MKKEKKSSAKRVLCFVAKTALTVAGIIVIPPLVEKYSRKVYRESLKTANIDFDNMGPEIVPNKENEGE